MSIEIEVEKVLAETDSAMLCKFMDEDTELWVPFSQCDKITREGGQVTSVLVTDWWYRKVGLG